MDGGVWWKRRWNCLDDIEEKKGEQSSLPKMDHFE
jgi:hypothetical protein